MILKKHKDGIADVLTWESKRPPMKKIQWKDGRSAKELAKYMTGCFPNVPKEFEEVLLEFVPANSEFDWDAEYKTDLPGKGEGRNHDAVLIGKELLVTIEAKTDETLGTLIRDEINSASVNKLCRISEMLSFLFRGGFKEYCNLRYQLLTAAAGTILEAEKRGIDTALMCVLVFKSAGTVKNEKLIQNHGDIENFLDAVNAVDERNCKIIPNNSNVKLYFKEIVI